MTLSDRDNEIADNAESYALALEKAFPPMEDRVRVAAGIMAYIGGQLAARGQLHLLRNQLEQLMRMADDGP